LNLTKGLRRNTANSGLPRRRGSAPRPAAAAAGQPAGTCAAQRPALGPLLEGRTTAKARVSPRAYPAAVMIVDPIDEKAIRRWERISLVVVLLALAGFAITILALWISPIG
jgi:hypothetical protein